MPIPKILHRIWFGEPFPNKYQQYLLDMAKLHPTYQTKLWSDPENMSAQNYATLEKFCKENKIELCNIRENKDLPNLDLILRELEIAKKNEFYRRIHYARASDLARISILYNEGGIYMDTDSEMTKPFPEMPAKHGFHLKLPEGTDPNHLDLVQYDFMAATPQHELFKMTLDINQMDYKTYDKSKNKSWEHSLDRSELRTATIALTGSALQYAIKYQFLEGYYKGIPPSEILFDTSPFMVAHFDTSWLIGFEKSFGRSHTKADAFFYELIDARLKVFPISKIDNTYAERKMKKYLEPDPLFIKALAQESKLVTAQHKDVYLPNPTPKFIISTKLPFATIPSFDYKFTPIELPHIGFSKSKLPEIHFTQPVFLTKEKILQIYNKHGGGGLAKFSIFKDKYSVDKIIDILKVRAAENPNGASKKTLDELKIAITPKK